VSCRRGEAGALQRGAPGLPHRASIRFLPSINCRGDLRPRDRRERMVPIGMSKIVAVPLRASAKVGTELPGTLLRNRAHEDVLEIRRGQTHEHSVAAAEFLFREVDRIRSSSPPNLLGEIPPGVAPQSGWHRCNLDYSEAQPFKDLLLYRALRRIGDELHAGLAGSSRISVEDFQTHPLDPSATAPIEHSGEIRSRIASETTYGGRDDRQVEDLGFHRLARCPLGAMLIADSAAARRPGSTGGSTIPPSRANRSRVLVSLNSGTPRYGARVDPHPHRREQRLGRSALRWRVV
jgi:hypothetical protein